MKTKTRFILADCHGNHHLEFFRYRHVGPLISFKRTGCLRIHSDCLVMDDILRQRCSTNAWDHINMRRYQPPGPDKILSLSSSFIDNGDQNGMDLDGGFSEGFNHSFEEQC